MVSAYIIGSHGECVHHGIPWWVRTSCNPMVSAYIIGSHGECYIIWSHGECVHHGIPWWVHTLWDPMVSAYIMGSHGECYIIWSHGECVHHGIPWWVLHNLIPWWVRTSWDPILYALTKCTMFIYYWPEDGSLKSKYIANCVLIIIYVLCLTEQITLSYCVITQQDSSYQNFRKTQS